MKMQLLNSPSDNVLQSNNFNITQSSNLNVTQLNNRNHMITQIMGVSVGDATTNTDSKGNLHNDVVIIVGNGWYMWANISDQGGIIT